MQHLFGVLIVVIHHILAVPLGGGRAGAFVEYRFDLAELFASHNLDQKIFFIHVVSDVQIHQVYEFGAVFQIVYNQNIGNAFVIQGFNDVAADKACAAGYDDHNCTFEVEGPETIRTRILISYHYIRKASAIRRKGAGCA